MREKRAQHGGSTGPATSPFQRLALTFKKKLAVSLVYPAAAGDDVLVIDRVSGDLCSAGVAKLFENLNAQLPAITVLMLAWVHARRNLPLSW